MADKALSAAALILAAGKSGGGSGAVSSVNGKTGTVVLDASDVGALPTSTTIPTKTSELTNDSGFLTSHQSLADYSTTAQMNTAIAAHHDSTKQDTLSSDPAVGNVIAPLYVDTGELRIELGNGVHKTSDDALEVEVKTDGGITLDANGISVDTSIIQPKLTAGTNITIDANNVISTSATSVSGTNDGTNWSTITIGDTTKAIPSGGSGGGVIVEGTGTNSMASTVGTAATASGTNTIAIGNGAQAFYGNGIAIGFNSATTNYNTDSVSIGHNSIANGSYDVSLGPSATSSNNYSIGIGSNSNASHEGDIAIGYRAQPHGSKYGTALGSYSGTNTNSGKLTGWHNFEFGAIGGATSNAYTYIFGQYNASDCWTNYNVWDSSTTYNTGDIVRRWDASNQVYVISKSLVDNNTGNTPQSYQDDSYWQRVYNPIEISNNNVALVIGNGTSDAARSNALVVQYNGNAQFAGAVTATNIPAPPSTDGEYDLHCSIVDGVITYSWQSAS